VLVYAVIGVLMIDRVHVNDYTKSQQEGTTDIRCVAHVLVVDIVRRRFRLSDDLFGFFKDFVADGDPRHDRI